MACTRDLTVRSVAIGAILVVLVSVGAPYAKYILHSSLLACDYLPFGVVFPFLAVVGLVNPVLKRLSSRYALAPGELAVAFTMALVASTTPTFGLTGYLVATIASPFYYATTENGWSDYLHPHLPRWLLPGNETGAMTRFFEGLSPGEAIPWEAWLTPLAWWLSFFAALIFACFCAVSLLRRQWIDRERIVFPLARVPLEMVRESDSPARLPAFMRPVAFWAGFAVSSATVCWNAIGYFFPGFPAIPLKGSLQLFRGALPLRLNVYFPLIGFAYLINLDVAFSIWFFHLLATAQVALYSRLGFSAGAGDVYCSWSPEMAWHGFGALTAMVGWGIWVARSHLLDAVRTALGRAGSLDDTNELLRYRTSIVGLVVAVGYVFCFLLATGMAPTAAGIFLAGVFVIYLGVTRIVIEGGLVFLRGPMIAQHLTTYSLGVSSISPASMAALAVSYAWFCDIKSFFMPAVAHAAKLSDALRMRPRSVAVAVAAALVLGVGTSLTYTLWIGYEHGAYNFGDWIFRGGAETPYNAIINKMRNPFDTGWLRLGLMAAGACVMGLLTYLRYRSVRWPLHPIGFPIAYTLPVRISALSIFLSWAAKSIILKFGGVELYRKTRPFFLGLIIGYFAACGLSFAIDMVWFPGQGHAIYGW